MAGVADEEHLPRLSRVARDLHMDLRDQRARGVKYLERAAFRFFLDGARDAVGAEDHRGAIGHFVKLFHEYRADRAQPIHHIFVMDHFMPHVDGCTE